MAALYEKLEVWGFENDAIIFNDLSFGAIFQISPFDISCNTDDQLNLLHNSAVDFLNGLPPGISIQFVQHIHGGSTNSLSLEKQSTDNTVANELSHMRHARLKELDECGEIKSQTLYLSVRRRFDQAKKEKYGWIKKSKKDLPDLEADVEREIDSFDGFLASIQGSLESLGVSAKRLSKNEVFRVLFDQWNPNYPVDAVNFNCEDIRDDLILSDMVVSLKGFALGTVHHRVLSLKIMPDQTFAAMSEKLRELPFDSKSYLSIEILDQNKETFALETQRRIAYAMYSGKKGVSDLESASKLQDIEALLSKRVTGDEKIFSVALNVVLRNENEELLDTQIQVALQKLRELSGAEGMVETLAAGPIFFELALPNARCKERSRRIATSALADFLPLFGDWPGHNDPKIILRNRRGSILKFDPFSPQLANFNQVVSGGSGSGKSYLLNLLIMQLIKENPRVFILDIGGSYKRICDNLNGQYLALGADSKIALNPFDIVDQSAESIDQKIKFMTSLVELMTKEEESLGIGKLERSEIERLVKEVLREESAPRLSRLQARLLNCSDPNLKRISTILGPWCGDSPYGKFIDRETNLLLHRNIVCFDLKGLESQPDLQAACLFLIADFVWREVQKDRTSIKLVVFDECWKHLENKAAARFIGEIYRTFRKYKASAIAISQSMDDFAKSQIASAILPNSSVKWLLKQTGANFNSLKEILSLNEREIQLVESLTAKKGFFAESFLISGDDRQVAIIESTPLEYWLATTDPADIKAIEIETESNPHIDNLDVLRILAQKYPHGASHAK